MGRSPLHFSSMNWIYGRPAGAALMLLVGGALQVAGVGGAAWAWWVGVIGIGLPLVWRTLRGLLQRRFAADVVAMLAILLAIALGQPLAGLVIVLMQSGGEALDRYAEGRASAAVQTLEADAPRIAHRRSAAGWDDIPVADVTVGDRLLVRPGEMIPCDGAIESGRSRIDQSRLTGEPLPVSAAPGIEVVSGSLNLDAPLEMRALRVAAESQYAAIVRMVRSAQASKAPLQREADRWAVWFTPITLLACLLAWLVSQDLERVLTVLVVATPCPLILAAPVAVIGGIDRGARGGLIFRTGGALEHLGRISAAILDKTGTLTIGRPRLVAVEPLDGRTEDEWLRVAAAIEQGAGHHMARSIVAAALARGVQLPVAESVMETPGSGVTGRVEGREVAIGSASWLGRTFPAAAAAFAVTAQEGSLVAFALADGRPGARFRFADELRPNARRLVDELRGLGVRRVLLLSGDHEGRVRTVAGELGITEYRADVLPGDKLLAVRALQDAGERVLMFGDGTNDAPALAAADVGAAIAAHGGGVSAEAAGVVLLREDLRRIPWGIRLGRRTLRVARQSIGAGLGLSMVAMGFAIAGYLGPVVGALIQEGIDVTVILWALRSANPDPSDP